MAAADPMKVTGAGKTKQEAKEEKADQEKRQQAATSREHARREAEDDVSV